MEKKKLIVFDFDGVISNSVHDSYLTALNTYHQFVPDHNLPIHKPISPPDKIYDFEKKNPDLFKQFSNLMPMGNRAEDYYIILKSIDDGIYKSIIDDNEYQKYRNSLNENDLKDYHELFYVDRRARQESDPEAWCGLMPPFPGVVDAIIKISKTCDLAIATSKDRQSIELQLNSYGLRSYFPDKNILDKDFSNSKCDHLTRFHKSKHVDYKNMHFIDDKVIHLRSVKTLGVHCYLAEWGFNRAREKEIAKTEGFQILTLKNLKNLYP